MDVKKIFTDKKFIISIAVLCSVLWGSAFPVLKVSYIELNMSPNDMAAKIVFAGMRFFLASLLLFILLMVFMRQSIKINKNSFWKLLGLGVLQTTLQYFFFYNGLANTSGMKGSILGSVGTFFVVIIAHIIYSDDKINNKKIIGLITGFSGIVLVNWGKSFNLSFSFFGEGFLILSSFVGAFGTIIAKDLSKSLHPFLVTAWQMLLGSMLLLIFGIPRLGHNSMTFTAKGWILLIYAAFLSATAFSLWYSLLKYNKAGEISLYKFMIPVSGAILSSIFIPGEKFSGFIFLALTLVVIGIIAINYSGKEKKIE